MATARFVEQRLMRRREQEAKDTDIKRDLAEQRMFAEHAASAVRVDGKRRARSEAAERRELFMDYQHVTSEQDKARKKHITMFEEHIAEELSKRKASKLREEAEKRRICDGSEELRALKERLHMAKVNKQRAQQLLESGVREKREQLREQMIAECMENERLQHIELEHKLNLEKMRQRERVKSLNLQQIAMKEVSRQEAQQECLKERAQVEEAADRVAREDQEEQRARWAKKLETKAAFQRHMAEQGARQREREREERDEAARIEQFAAAKRAAEDRRAEAKAEQEREKSRVLKSMIGQMEAKNRAAEEFEQLRNDLANEELEEERRRREDMEMRKRMEDKVEMRNAYMFQMKQNEERAARARADESKFREELLNKFAEDDRIEQMNEKKQRMKVQEHRREADRLIALRRERYEQERAAEREAEGRLRAEEARRQAVVEEERRRLLQEHASEFGNFLPKGVLQSKEEYSFIMGRPRPASAPSA